MAESSSRTTAIAATPCCSIQATRGAARGWRTSTARATSSAEDALRLAVRDGDQAFGHLGLLDVRVAGAIDGDHLRRREPEERRRAAPLAPPPRRARPARPPARRRGPGLIAAAVAASSAPSQRDPSGDRGAVRAGRRASPAIAEAAHAANTTAPARLGAACVTYTAPSATGAPSAATASADPERARERRRLGGHGARGDGARGRDHG